MALQFEAQDWVSGATGGSIDSAQLERATFGDRRLAREVLGLFADQSGRLVREIGSLGPDTPALVHKLKGSAQAVGAWAVAEAATAMEIALASSADAGVAAALLARRVDETCRAIAGLPLSD